MQKSLIFIYTLARSFSCLRHVYHLYSVRICRILHQIRVWFGSVWFGLFSCKEAHAKIPKVMEEEGETNLLSIIITTSVHTSSSKHKISKDRVFTFFGGSRFVLLSKLLQAAHHLLLTRKRWAANIIHR